MQVLWGKTGSLWSLLGLLGAGGGSNRTRSWQRGTPWTTPHPPFSKHLSALCGTKKLKMPFLWLREGNVSGSKPNIQTLAFWHPKKSRGFCFGRRKVLEIEKWSAQVKYRERCMWGFKEESTLRIMLII